MRSASVVAFGLALAFSLVSCRSETPAPQGPPQAPASAAPEPPAALLSPEKAAEKAPEVYKARFTTAKGDFVIEVRRAWAPNGADRFYNLVRIGYYDGISFFRVVKGFMAQTGIHGSPAVSAKWLMARIPDDPPAGQSNARGTVTFATSGPNARTTHFFINYGNNANLDSVGFTPIGTVVQGMEVVESLYGGYGDSPAFGVRGPDQGRLTMEGNAYLKAEFPDLDYVKATRID